jgi:hypothetical protein
MLDAAWGGTGDAETQARFGGDLKAGLGPNLTLDATVNPDFGQVEADPAKVNLTAFETYFPEQRPFFLEGREIFGARGPNWFYSRRVGSVAAPAGDIVRVEKVEQATILGGAKITGRLPSGSSVGVLAALTQGERVPVPAAPGTTREVAARTGFLVGRFKQEVGAAGSSIGITTTGVQRSLETGGVLDARLPSEAFAGGADATIRFGGSRYELTTFLGGSTVSGSPSAIGFLQRTTGHFFQRPDADHVEYDPTLTRMSGWSAGLNLGKVGGEPWVWSVDVVATSPGFEIRDAGSQVRSDLIEVRTSVGYNQWRDQGVLRNRRYGIGLASGWNFAGDRRILSPSLYLATSWSNLWTSVVQVGWTGPQLSDDLARGGPLMLAPGAVWGELDIMSANSSRAWWNLNATAYDDSKGGLNGSVTGTLTMTAGRRLELGLVAGGSRGTDSRQYLAELSGGSAATYGRRYVFSRLQRDELFAQLRAKLAFAPDAELTLYAEPFVSSGQNSHFGELVAARSGDLRIYGSPGSGATLIPLEDGAHQVVEGRRSFRIEDYDYWVRSFRGMGVLRWEWRPGSMLFLIWQRSLWAWTSDEGPVGTPSLMDSIKDPGQDIALIKASILLGRR